MVDNQAATVAFGFHGLAVVGGALIPHTVTLDVTTDYETQGDIPKFNEAGMLIIPVNKTRKVGMSWFGFSPLLLTKLSGASVAAGGNEPINEMQVVATLSITLTNTPIASYEHALVLYEKTGGKISKVYTPVAATPEQDEFTYVPATGVVTFGGTVADDTEIWADYLHDQAVKGYEIVLGTSFAGPLDLIGIGGQVELPGGTFGDASIQVPGAVPLGEPPLFSGSGKTREISVEFSVPGEVRVFIA